MTMNICRFKNKSNETRIGLVTDDSTLLDLAPAGIKDLEQKIKLSGSKITIESKFSEPSNGTLPLLYLGVLTNELTGAGGGLMHTFGIAEYKIPPGPGYTD